MNMTEELNILDKHINYIAGYEAGTPLSDIITIITILNISHGQYSGIFDVLYILALALEPDDIQETVQHFSLLQVVGSFLSHVFI